VLLRAAVRSQIVVGEDGHFTVRLDGAEAEFLVMTGAEADEAVAQYVRDTIQHFTPSFIAKHTHSSVTASVVKVLCEAACYFEHADQAVDALLELVGERFDDFVAEAIAVDGRGHFLGSYDGTEHEHGNGNLRLYLVDKDSGFEEARRHAASCDLEGCRGGRAFDVRGLTFCSPSCGNEHWNLQPGDSDHWPSDSSSDAEQGVCEERHCNEPAVDTIAWGALDMAFCAYHYEVEWADHPENRHSDSDSDSDGEWEEDAPPPPTPPPMYSPPRSPPSRSPSRSPPPEYG